MFKTTSSCKSCCSIWFRQMDCIPAAHHGWADQYRLQASVYNLWTLAIMWANRCFKMATVVEMLQILAVWLKSLLNIVDKLTFFCISQGSEATIYRWGAHVYKFSVASFFRMQYAKKLKLFNFSQSYSRNKKCAAFLNTMYFYARYIYIRTYVHMSVCMYKCRVKMFITIYYTMAK